MTHPAIASAGSSSAHLPSVTDGAVIVTVLVAVTPSEMPARNGIEIDWIVGTFCNYKYYTRFRSSDSSRGMVRFAKRFIASSINW